jgi:regulator of replication initiation timing
MTDEETGQVYRRLFRLYERIADLETRLAELQDTLAQRGRRLETMSEYASRLAVENAALRHLVTKGKP